MHLMKKISVLALGGFVTFSVCNYFTASDKKLDRGYSSYNILDEESVSKNLVNEKKLALASTPKELQNTTSFYQNTYAPALDENGYPKLKHGKRYYNEAYMEEISTNANIEQVNSDFE